VLLAKLLLHIAQVGLRLGGASGLSGCLYALGSSQFKHVSRFGRIDYFITLICVALAAVLLMAPSIHHRILFRQGETVLCAAVITGLWFGLPLLKREG
jgi:hypothetical protein